MQLVKPGSGVTALLHQVKHHKGITVSQVKTELRLILRDYTVQCPSQNNYQICVTDEYIYITTHQSQAQQVLSYFSGRCIRKMLFTQVSPAARPVLYCTVPRPRPRNCTAFIGLGLKYLSAVFVRPVLYHLLSGFIGLGLKYLSAGQGVDLLYITSGAQRDR